MGSCGGSGDPQSIPTPSTQKAVVFVHGGGWISRPTTGTTPANADGLKTLVEASGYKYIAITYPIATDTYKSFPDAHKSVKEQLAQIKREYSKVYVVASSAGANVAALAILEDSTIADKFAGFYGVYDIPSMDSGFNTTYSDKYTNDYVSASPDLIGQLPIPSSFWHGGSDILVPSSQSVNYSSGTAIIESGQGHSYNIASVSGTTLMAFLNAP